MTLSMKADIKERWIQELESGNYRQGGGSLHERGGGIPSMGKVRDEKFCCLGVLCKMAEEAGAVEITSTEEHGALVQYGDQTAYLPVEVIQWAEISYEGSRAFPDLTTLLEEERGVIEYIDDDRMHPSNLVSLSLMNDQAVPFSEIAQVIREKVIGV